MKKTKICNIVMMIVNLIAIILSTNIGIDTEKFAYSISFIDNDMIVDLIKCSIFDIIIVVTNILMIIINRKDKKIRFYYFVLIIPIVAKIISAFLTESDTIVYLIMALALVITICIYNIKNRKGKWKVIIPIITIIVAIALIFINESWIDNYFLLTCILFGAFVFAFIIFIIRNKEVEEISSKGVILSIIFSVIVITCAIGEKCCIWYVQGKADDMVCQIEGYVKANSRQDTEELYIPVCKDGKWGYVNEKGEQIIECKYDLVSNLRKIKFENDSNVLNIAAVRDGEKVKIISEKDEVICELTGEINKQIMKQIDETNENYGIYAILYFPVALTSQLEEKENKEKIIFKEDENPFGILGIFEYTYKPYIEIMPDKNGTYKIETDKVKYEIETTLEEDNNAIPSLEDSRVSEIREEVLELETGEKLYTEYNDIKTFATILQDDQEIKKEIDVNFDYIDEENYAEDIEEKQQCLRVFSDGYLPYYNLEEKVQGYYDENLELVRVRGNYQILDIKNDIMFARKFDDEGKTEKIVALNIKNKEQKVYKQIMSLKNGYIVKKQNDEMVLLDDNLEEISEEYTLFITNYAEKGILIGVKLNENKPEFSLMDLKGKELNQTKYDNITSFDEQLTVQGIKEQQEYWDGGIYLLDTEYSEYYNK